MIIEVYSEFIKLSPANKKDSIFLKKVFGDPMLGNNDPLLIPMESLRGKHFTIKSNNIIYSEKKDIKL